MSVIGKESTWAKMFVRDEQPKIALEALIIHDPLIFLSITKILLMITCQS